MGIYPSQVRTVDPYASYHSNVVNKLTRIASRGQDCIFSKNQIDVLPDTTSTVIVSIGECFKDDVLIEIDAQHSVDFEDLTNYVSPGAGFNEAGYYYIVLDYVYSKARPAPQASIKILKPSQRALISGASYLFLKAVLISGPPFQIVSLHDIDLTAGPAYSDDAMRKFTQMYFGLEFTLPTFVAETDESRVIYVLDEDEVYYGTSGHWEPLSAVRAAIDTTGTSGVGYLAYINGAGNLVDAISTAPTTLADCIVTSYGASNGEGMVRLVGPVSDVVVESGITAAVGDKMYLSDAEQGTVTNAEPLPYSQYVGVCTAIGTPGPGGTISMWAIPLISNGGVGGTSGGGYGTANSFMYQFDSDTTDNDPGVGKLKVNNANRALVNRLNIDFQTNEAGNPDISAWLATLDDSDSTVKGHIKVSLLNHPETFMLYEITTMTTPGSYVRFVLAYVTHNGTIANNDYIVLSYSRTGDKGDEGTGYNSALQGPAATWTITHSLGHRLCVVTVCNASYEVVIPQSITFDAVNQLTVVFPTAQSGYVSVY